MVEKISDLTDKNARATVLSVESQMTSLFIIVAAPLIGLVFDQYGFEYVFMFLGVLSILMYITTKK
jgi:predicted MFS family arabinose efflux permease